MRRTLLLVGLMDIVYRTTVRSWLRHALAL
jgi:hypothetical protein